MRKILDRKSFYTQKIISSTSFHWIWAWSKRKSTSPNILSLVNTWNWTFKLMEWLIYHTYFWVICSLLEKLYSHWHCQIFRLVYLVFNVSCLSYDLIDQSTYSTKKNKKIQIIPNTTFSSHKKAKKSKNTSLGCCINESDFIVDTWGMWLDSMSNKFVNPLSHENRINR